MPNLSWLHRSPKRGGVNITPTSHTTNKPYYSVELYTNNAHLVPLRNNACSCCHGDCCRHRQPGCKTSVERHSVGNFPVSLTIAACMNSATTTTCSDSVKLRSPMKDNRTKDVKLAACQSCGCKCKCHSNHRQVQQSANVHRSLTCMAEQLHCTTNGHQQVDKDINNDKPPNCDRDTTVTMNGVGSKEIPASPSRLGNGGGVVLRRRPPPDRNQDTNRSPMKDMWKRLSFRYRKKTPDKTGERKRPRKYAWLRW